MSIRIDGTNTTANPGITGGDADTGLQFGTDEIQLVTGGTNRATVESNGNFTIEDGNLVVASGHGIDFSATADSAATPGMTGELLNDYEEGKWTPQDASGAGLSFVSSTDGHYVKIGNFFHCWGRVTFPVTASTNAVEITNLPFTSSGVNIIYSGATSITNSGRANLLVMYEDTRVVFRNESNSNFTNSQFSNSFVYFTFQGYTGTV